MDIIQAVIHKVGYLTYTFPAAFLVLFIRESTRISFMKKYVDSSERSLFSNPINSIDPLGLFCLSLTNISWGGFIQKKRKDYWLGFLISQLALLVLMMVTMIYLNLKKPTENSYLYSFCHTIIKQSWLMFFINFIPLPPFDFSFFYMQNRYMGPVQFISKGITLVILVGGWFDITKYIPSFLL